jgi:hypothetical protein
MVNIVPDGGAENEKKTPSNGVPRGTGLGVRCLFPLILRHPHDPEPLVLRLGMACLDGANDFTQDVRQEFVLRPQNGK